MTWYDFAAFYLSVVFVVAISLVSILKGNGRWVGDQEDIFYVCLISVFWPVAIVLFCLWGVWKLLDLLTDRLGAALKQWIDRKED